MKNYSILNECGIIKHLLRGDLVITPLIDAERQIGPTSVDIRLGFEFGVFNITKFTHIDPLIEEADLKRDVKDYVTTERIGPLEDFILHPGEFVLASTMEYFRLPRFLAARLEGRSSWGRLGLQVHATAGFVDPGFEGILTFELQNVGKGALRLFPGVRIAQICFFRTNPTVIPYTMKVGAKYHRRLGAAGSLFYEDNEFKIIRRLMKRENATRERHIKRLEEEKVLDVVLEKMGHSAKNEFGVEVGKKVLEFYGKAIEDKIIEIQYGRRGKEGVVFIDKDVKKGRLKSWYSLKVNFRKLIKMIATAVAVAPGVAAAPWTTPFIVLVLLVELGDAKTLDLTEKHARILYTLAMMRKGVIPLEIIIEEVRKSLSISEEELVEHLKDLEKLNCVKEVDGKYSMWLLEEEVVVDIGQYR